MDALADRTNAVEIEMRNGEKFLVDESDVELVMSFGQRFMWGSYPSTQIKGCDGKWHTTAIHRIIMNAAKGEEVDHVNGIKTDLRRSNLRVGSHRKNMLGYMPTKPNSGTGYRSVFKRGGRFNVRIWFKGKSKSYGWFDTAEEASRYASEVREKIRELA